MNKSILLGRLTDDVKAEFTSTGKARARFTIAIDNGKDANGNKRPADFVNCIAWEKTAETIANFFGKGKPILVVGKVKTDSYEKNGQKKSFTYVLVNSFEFVPASATAKAEHNEPQLEGFETFSSTEDDIPF